MIDEKERKTAMYDGYDFEKILGSYVESEVYGEAALLICETRDYCIREGISLDNLEQVRNAMKKEVAQRVGVCFDILSDIRFDVLAPLFKTQSEPSWEFCIDCENKLMGYSRRTSVSDALFTEFAERLSEASGSVLIAEAEKFMPNLKKLVDGHPDCSYTFMTTDLWVACAIRRIFKGYQNVKADRGYIYGGDLLDRFDFILAVPNFATRSLAQTSDSITREQETVAFQNLLLHLKDGGELVIIESARVTYAQGKLSDFRLFVQENYRIEEISELPEGTFYTTGIKTYLIAVRNVRPKEDDAITIRSYKAIGKNKREADKIEIENDTFITYRELSNMSDWNINMVFCRQDEEWQKLHSSEVTFCSLGKIADVFRGKAVTSKDPGGKIGVVNISNVGVYEIDYTSLDHLDEEERKVSSYLLHSGDVLLPARGTAIRAAVFTEQDYPCIASSNLIVIRPDKNRLNPVYLKMFFDSPIGAKLVSGTQQGSSVMNISYNDFKALEMPVPPIEDQNAKAARYQSEYEIYKQTIKAADSRWYNVLNELWSETEK